MAVRLFLPKGSRAMRRHAASLVIEDFWSAAIEIVSDSGFEWPTFTDGDNTLVLADDLFGTWTGTDARKAPLSQDPKARDPVPHEVAIDLGIETLPRIVERAPRRLDLQRQSVLDLDVLGSVFAIVTRLEELVSDEQDAHGRFPASEALATRGAFLDRPVADEYSEVLWSALRRTWPSLERPRSELREVYTFDVDNPFAHLNRSVGQLIASAVGNATVRRRPRRAVELVRDWIATKRQGAVVDPWNTFDVLMDVLEAGGHSGYFNFIGDPSRSGRNRYSTYRMEDPAIGALLARVDERGHHVGVHGSYRSHLEPARLQTELDRVCRASERVGHRESEWGGRQHYLRWDAAESPQTLEAAGMSYDMTVGFAEEVGFRSGTCRPHRLFDFASGISTRVVEHPTLVMDRTLVDPRYMGLDIEQAYDEVDALRRRCRRFGGEFVTLWHNDLAVEGRTLRILQGMVDG